MTRRGRRWWSGRDRWEVGIVVATAIVLAVTLLAAAGSIRARGRLRAGAIASLENYVAVALERYANAFETTLRQSFFPVIPPSDGSYQPRSDPLPLEDIAWMIQRLPRDPCRCLVSPGPARLFRIGLSDGSEAAADSAGQPLPAVDPEVAAAVRGRADSLGTIRFGMLLVRTPDDERFVFYNRRVNERSGHRYAYGFSIPAARLVDSILAPAFRETRLVPRHLADSIATNDEFLSLVVSSPAGTTLFATPMTFKRSVSDRFVMRPSRAGLILTGHLNPAMEGKLLSGGIPSLVPKRELALLGLAIGLWVVIAYLALRAADLARLRSDFASSVTHELRTPLTQIRLAAETVLLGRAPSRAATERALTSVIGEVDRLQYLVDNVLHYARAERRRTDVRLEPVHLRTLAGEVVADLEPALPPLGPRIEVVIADDVEVLGDAAAIRHILLNLLDNGARYGGAGGPLTLGARVSRGRVEIWVADRGPGIPRGDRQRVLKPFVRLVSTAGTAPAGTGLGLAVVRELVEAQRGRLRIEDAAGGGCRVAFFLPIALPAVSS